MRPPPTFRLGVRGWFLTSPQSRGGSQHPVTPSEAEAPGEEGKLGLSQPVSRAPARRDRCRPHPLRRCCGGSCSHDSPLRRSLPFSQARPCAFLPGASAAILPPPVFSARLCPARSSERKNLMGPVTSSPRRRASSPAGPLQLPASLRTGPLLGVRGLRKFLNLQELSQRMF